MIGAVGAVLAAVIAAAASPLFPVGLAAEAEPHPGFRADWVALTLGMAAVAVAVVACGAWPAARAASWRRNGAALAVRRPRGASLGRLPLPRRPLLLSVLSFDFTHEQLLFPDAGSGLAKPQMKRGCEEGRELAF